MTSMKVSITLVNQASALHPKTNVKCVKSIQINGQPETYGFPAELSPICAHPELIKHGTIKNALDQIECRGKSRKVKLL